MALTPDELIVLAPELEKLAKLIGESLKKDENGKVNITKEEGKKIAKAVATLSVKLAKEAID
jgi:hypothetical protein